MALFAMTAKAQDITLATSAVQWLTGTVNAEAGYTIHNHLSAQASLSYNPWRYGDTRLQQLTFRPGLRWWPERVHAGWFLSSAWVLSRYNMGGVFSGKYRYDGKGYGLSLGGGFSRILSDRWNIEAEIGCGLLWNDYDRLTRHHGSRYADSHHLWKIVPVKADISLVYFL